jgi:hypothetical protein
MIRYLVIHNKHEGCYDFHCFEDHENKRRLTSITINPPKIFMFNDKEQAHDFFNEYIAEVDIVDPNCKDGEEIEHVDFCTCGIVELDDDENPVLFYNKRNQVFFLEMGGQVFLPPQNTKNNIDDMNLTNRLIRRCKHLDSEQKLKYIELGKTCEESMKNASKEENFVVSSKKEEEEENIVLCKPVSEAKAETKPDEPAKKARKPKAEKGEEKKAEPKVKEPKVKEPKVKEPKAKKEKKDESK